MLKTYNKANYFLSSLLRLLRILWTDFQVKNKNNAVLHKISLNCVRLI
ncbi:hypothetical protein DFQ12_0010 [Sphingobacterium detergens]|uniref:Uncharacterized protein n=1 Tax=Sphingobacterium detergens TaxID=1145106 RepID=A0A420BEQ5_SPHD1|nr:hypothetical protein DFQ12_0010 [Sphingobacterium detergens]